MLRGAELIGLSRDRTFPDARRPVARHGAVLAAVEEAAGRRADRIVGKPEPGMYEAARDRLGAGPALAVGDRLDTDVAGARAAGARPGARAHRRARRARMRAAADPRPTLVAESLGDAGARVTCSAP